MADLRLASNSELSAHAACGFRWLMQYHLELRRPSQKGSASAADVGTDIHECIAHALRGGDWEDAHAEIVRRRGLLPDDADIARGMRAWQEAAGELYGQLAVVAVEVRLQLLLDGMAGVDGLAGVLDVVAVNRHGDRVVIDHKSTRTSIGQWQAQWGMQADHQIRVYDWLAEQVLGGGANEEPAVVRIDHVDAKRGSAESSAQAVSTRARGHMGARLLRRLRLMGEDVDAFAGVTADDLDDPQLGALMVPGRHCMGCDYREMCRKRLRGEPGLSQVAQEQLVYIGRLDHHEKP